MKRFRTMVKNVVFKIKTYAYISKEFWLSFKIMSLNYTSKFSLNIIGNAKTVINREMPPICNVINIVIMFELALCHNYADYLTLLLPSITV